MANNSSPGRLVTSPVGIPCLPSGRDSASQDEHYDAIRNAFLTALNDPTGSSDGEFARLMDEAFVRIFAEELAKAMANKLEICNG